MILPIVKRMKIIAPETRLVTLKRNRNDFSPSPLPGTYDPPPRPPYGALSDASPPPYPVGTIVFYRCENGTTFAGGRRHSRVELTEDGWTRLDADFLCFSRELVVSFSCGGPGRNGAFS